MKCSIVKNGVKSNEHHSAKQHLAGKEVRRLNKIFPRRAEGCFTKMHFSSAVRITGLLFPSAFLLSVHSGVFAGSTNVSQRRSLTYAAKQSVIKNVAEAIVCDICKMTVKLVQSALWSPELEDLIANIATKVCIEIQIEDEYICTELVQEYKVCCGLRESRIADVYIRAYSTGRLESTL